MFIHEAFPVSLILVIFESLINITAPCIMASKWIATWLTNECLLSDLISPCVFAHFTMIYPLWYHHCLTSFTKIRANACLLNGSLDPRKDTKWEKRTVWGVHSVSLKWMRKSAHNTIATWTNCMKCQDTLWCLFLVAYFTTHRHDQNPSCWDIPVGVFVDWIMWSGKTQPTCRIFEVGTLILTLGHTFCWQTI